MTRGSQLFTLAGPKILAATPKRIALSGFNQIVELLWFTSGSIWNHI